MVNFLLIKMIYSLLGLNLKCDELWPDLSAYIKEKYWVPRNLPAKGLKANLSKKEMNRMSRVKRKAPKQRPYETEVKKARKQLKIDSVGETDHYNAFDRLSLFQNLCFQPFPIVYARIKDKVPDLRQSRARAISSFLLPTLPTLQLWYRIVLWVLLELRARNTVIFS